MKQNILNQKHLNLVAGVLAVMLVIVLAVGYSKNSAASHTQVSDGIEQIDLDTIYLKNSGVEVNFADVILSAPNETRKLIVSTQTGTVTAKLTDRLIQQLDFDFMKKTQNVSYTGTGYFVVDLDHLTAANIIEDRDTRTVIIRIGHSYLQAIEIDPNRIMIGDVKESLLARGDIKLTVSDYNTVEKELRSRLEAKFNTAQNGQAADDFAIQMVREVYEPIVRAIDPRYRVIVEFKS